MSFKKWGGIIISGLILGMVFFAFSIQARAALPLQMKLKIGFEDRYRIGTWAPLRVLLENQGRSIEGTLLIKLSREDILEQKYVETLYSIPITLPNSSRKLYQVNVLLESDVHSLKVLLLADENILIEREIHLERFYSKDGFILVVNRTHSGFDFLNPLKVEKMRRVLYVDPDELPDRWIGYDAIQALILDDVTLVELTHAQQKAIKMWLSSGGTLIITARGGYGKFKSPLLLDLLPLKSLEKTYLSSPFPSLEERYGSLEESPRRIELWKSQWQEGDVLIREKGVPLLVRLKRDQGRIFFLAFDSFQPPFKNWSGIPYLWNEMLTEEIAYPLFSQGILDAIASHSFSWQRRLYPGLKELAIFILLYLLLLGFFSWQRIKGKSPRKMTIGLVIITLSFISISYLMGARIREKNTSLRQISIFYQKQGDSLARTVSYLNLFSPYLQSVELKFDEERCFVSSPLIPEQERLFNNLMVYPGEGKIRWSSTFTPPWSFHVCRLETILPFSIKVRIREEKEITTVHLENLNPFPLKDILLLHEDRSSFLEELSPSGRADLILKKREKFTLSSYVRKIGQKDSESDAELRGQIFQQIWGLGMPLKEVITRFPVLLAWFEKSPQAVVGTDQRCKLSFTGLLIMPITLSQP